MEKTRQSLLLTASWKLIRAGDHGAAAALLRKGLAKYDLDTQGLEGAAKLAIQCGDFELAALPLTRLHERDPKTLAWPRRLARMAVQTHDYNLAKTWLERASEIDPHDQGIRQLRARIERGREDPSSPAFLQAALTNPAVPVKVGLLAAKRLIFKGITRTAREGLEGLATRPGVRDKALREIRIQLKVIEAIEAGQAAGGELPALDTDAAAVLHRQVGSNDAALVFSGIDGSFGNVPLNLIQALLAPLGVNAIYLTDVHRLAHLTGNQAFGADYVQTIRGLRRQLEDWGVRRLVTIGASAGGFAALRYAADLGANQMLGFGAVTMMSKDLLWEEGRGQTIKARLERHAADMIEPIKPRLAARGGRLLVDLYYGAGMALDKIHAEAIGDLDHVRLHEVEGLDEHGVAGELLLRGELPDIFAAPFQDRRAAA